MKRISVLGLAALAATLLAAGQDAVTMKRQYTNGQTFLIRMVATVKIMGATAEMSSLVTQKVADAKSNGEYAVECSQSDVKLTIADEPQTPPAGEDKSTIKIGADGTVLNIQARDVGSTEYRLANLLMVLMPSKAVAPGDKWSQDLKANTKLGTPLTKVEFTYVRPDKVGEIPCFVLQSTVKEMEGTSPASSETTFWMKQSDMSLLKLESTWTKVPFPAAPIPVDAKVVMTRENP